MAAGAHFVAHMYPPHPLPALLSTCAAAPVDPGAAARFQLRPGPVQCSLRRAPTTVSAALQLLKWLLARLRPRETDGNKQYASEILAILVQQSGEHQECGCSQCGWMV